MNRSNIILDFIDPENRILYGSYNNLHPDEHVRLLKEGLNLAAFICDEYCILPPCAIMQCRIARRALMESPWYFDEGIIRFPMRESSIDVFLEKKRKNYALDQTDDDYREFFAEGGPAFLREHATGIIKRNTKIGDAIAAMVEATPFDHPLWQALTENYPQSVWESIRSAPRELVDRNEAISVKAIKRLRNLGDYKEIDFHIGQILQNKYFYAYIYEYGAKVISGVKIKTTDFKIEHFGPAYEYSYWIFLLKALGLRDMILKSDSGVIVELRDTPGCYEFVSAAIALGSAASSIKEAKNLVSKVMVDVRRKLGKTMLPTYPPLTNKYMLNTETVEKVSKLFYTFLESWEAAEASLEKDKHLPMVPVWSGSKNRVMQLKQRLAPCDMEKPFVFVGYNRVDMEETVYRDCILLGKMGINYWVDNANMHGCDQNSEGWKTVVDEALSKCGVYLPYISPAFFDSQPCCEEVKRFFELNKNAGISILLKPGFSSDEIITKILSYNNILQGDHANNMIKLFKANAVPDNHRAAYAIDQLYRYCADVHFEHFISDSMFYNTFCRYGIVDKERFPDYQSWRQVGLQLIKEHYYEYTV